MTAVAPRITLPLHVKAAMYLRLFAVQGSWNYETLMGTGIGFVMEPALRRLPGGLRGPEYRAALARESRYFNAHP
jgi:mannose PTS system EIID component